MAITLDYVSDWITRLRGRLYTRFRNKTTWEGWVRLLGVQAQDLEDAVQSLFTLLDIDNSDGSNLDLIGRIVGRSRAGVDDATYRLYLRAAIAAASSTGTPENIYAVFTVLFPEMTFKIVTGLVKEFTLKINEVLTRAEAFVAKDFLADSKEAAARGIVIWQEQDTDLIFTYDTGGLGYDGGYYLGALQA